MISAATDSKTRLKNRLITIVSTVVATAVVYGVGKLVVGQPLEVPQTGGRPPLAVTLPMVLFISSAACLLG